MIENILGIRNLVGGAGLLLAILAIGGCTPPDRGTGLFTREYLVAEGFGMRPLVEAAGFQVDLLETGDYQNSQPDSEGMRRLLETYGCSTQLRGEVIYCRARKAGPIRERWPKELYYPP